MPSSHVPHGVLLRQQEQEEIQAAQAALALDHVVVFVLVVL